MSQIRESSRELNKLFAGLAHQIQPDLPEGWTHLAFGMFHSETEDDEFLIYVTTDGGQSWQNLQQLLFDADADMDGLLDAMDTAQEIREVCAAENDCWGSMNYHLCSTGEFHVSFDYVTYTHITEDIRVNWRKQELHL